MNIFEFIRGIFMFGGFLSGKSSAFPKQLSAAEERACLERCAEGDEDARKKLIEHNLRLVAHIAKKYSRSGADTDDFISIGTIGLIKGVNTFDMKKGTQLATYIARCIENEILMYLRADKKTASEISLAEAIGEDREGNSISLIDIIRADENDVDEQVFLNIEKEKLKQMIHRVLSRREKIVIDLRFGLSGGEVLPQRKIAELLGISRSYVSRIQKRALAKLAAEFERGGKK